MANRQNEELHSLATEKLFNDGCELFGYAQRRIAEGTIGEGSALWEALWKTANRERLAALSAEKRNVAAARSEGARSRCFLLC